MNYYLLKTEPGTYSIDNLAKDKKTVWDGVRNPQAVKVIQSMSPGDKAFIYHSGDERAIAGLAEVSSRPRPDPKNHKSYVVNLTFSRKFEKPVTLLEIKSSGKFNDWALIRQSRLSTMSVPEKFLAWLNQKGFKIN